MESLCCNFLSSRYEEALKWSVCMLDLSYLQLSVDLINDVGNEMHCIFRRRPTNLAITAIPKHYFRWKIALNAMTRNGSSGR